MELVGRHGRGAFTLVFFFNSFVKEKPLEIPKEPSICFRDRNKGEKL